jgi:outer membrane protein TolC
MSTPSFSEQVDALNRQLRKIEDRVGRGESPAVDLAEFKSAVDELRLRLWSLSRGCQQDAARNSREGIIPRVAGA